MRRAITPRPVAADSNACCDDSSSNLEEKSAMSGGHGSVRAMCDRVPTKRRVFDLVARAVSARHLTRCFAVCSSEARQQDASCSRAVARHVARAARTTRTSKNVLRLHVALRCARRGRAPRENDRRKRISGHVRGRDRRRSGDLTLFRRALCQLSYPAVIIGRLALRLPPVGFAVASGSR
jgi:hypothetical protein